MIYDRVLNVSVYGVVIAHCQKVSAVTSPRLTRAAAHCEMTRSIDSVISDTRDIDYIRAREDVYRLDVTRPTSQSQTLFEAHFVTHYSDDAFITSLRNDTR